MTVRNGYRLFKPHPISLFVLINFAVALMTCGGTLAQIPPCPGIPEQREEQKFQEEQVFQRAMDACTEEAGFRYYLRCFHDNESHREKAKTGLLDIEDYKESAKTEDAMPSWEEYLRKHPFGCYKDYANKRIKDIKSVNGDDAFSRAINAPTDKEKRERLEAFLKDFPNSIHAHEVETFLSNLDHEAFKQAETENTIDSYDRYLTQWPNGIHQPDARKNRLILDDNAYEAAHAQYTEKAFQDYLHDVKGGRHGDDAASAISDIKDYRRTSGEDTIKSYQFYLQIHKSGHFAPQAEARVDDLIFQGAIAEGTKDAIEAYLVQFPDGIHIGKASDFWNKLDEEEDNAEWASAKAQYTKEAFRFYLKRIEKVRHPLEAKARHKPEAGAAIDDIEDFDNAGKIDTPEAYQAYIVRHEKDGHFIIKANKALVDIRADEEAWRLAKESDTPDALNAYLKRYTRHSSDARTRIADIKQPRQCDWLAAEPEDPERVTKDGVSIKDLQRNAENAIQACEEAEKEFPNVARFKFQAARAHQAAGRLDAAEEIFKDLLSRSYIAVYDNLGWLYLGKNDLKLAEVYFRLGVEASHREAMTSYAILLDCEGDWEKSDYWISRAAELGEPHALGQKDLIQSGKFERLCPKEHIPQESTGQWSRPQLPFLLLRRLR